MRAWVVLTAVALGGCQTAAEAPQPMTPQPFPTNYRQLIVEHVRANYKDPYSIRDAGADEPAMGKNGKWSVCFRSNAKNSFGAYGGINHSLYVFQGSAIDTVITDEDSMRLGSLACSNKSYKPFNDLEGQKRHS